MRLFEDPRRALRAATVAVVVVWVPILLLWDPVLHLITVDDAFYYFTIGRNIADGAGSTFDGMNTTNGYHPLWMLVCISAFGVGLDGTAAIIALLLLQLLLWAGALWVLGDALVSMIDGWRRFDGRTDAPAAGRRGTAVVAVLWFLIGANPYILKLFVNGMETGLAVLIGALLLVLALRTEGDLLARPRPAAALMAALFLTRTDAAMLVGAAIVYSTLVRRRVDRTAIAVTGSLGAVVGLYLLSNLALVGHPLQISGVTKRVDPDGGRLLVIAMCVLIALGAVVVALRLRSRPSDDGRFPRLRSWYIATAWWVIGCLGLLAYDWGLSSEVYVWHYAPHALWLLATFVIAAMDIHEGATLERSDDEPGAVRHARLADAVVLLPFLVGTASTVGSAFDPATRLSQEVDRAAAAWMSDHLPADAVVGSGDAGVIGYFTERPVVNLDGLVNSYEWYDAKHDAPGATSAFLAEAGVTHVANHGDLVDGDDPIMRAVMDVLLGSDRGSTMRLLHVEEASGDRPYGTLVYELDG